MTDQPITTAPEFDIRDSRNVYQPCPQCGSTFGMGLTNLPGSGHVAVFCSVCWFHGPGVGFNPAKPLTADKPAFDAWNALPREAAGGKVGLTWFEHGVLDKTLWKTPRKVPDYLDDAEGAEWLKGYDSVEAESNV